MSVSVSARRLSAAAVAAAAVVGAVALPAAAAGRPAPQHRPAVVISDVHTHFLGRDNRSSRFLNQEWVDLTNTTRHTVNLNGWTLRDEEGHTYTFRHFRLGGRDTVRVHTGEGRDTRNDVYQDRRKRILDKAHDTVTLRDNRGHFVDNESWGHRSRGHQH
ncbi:lamin tail domain-containing protein [Streptomyces sp. NPDC086787]|uniref:lamin tail domain-containing protein n=1 Tax=Streptomyces sp. NPDC086787 TaxID=3365759 RepID=UPI0037F4AF04